MQETVYTAQSELRRPRRFLREAVEDLAHAAPIGWVLFKSQLRARRRRAWLGYLWIVLPALVAAALSTGVQASRIVSFGPTDLPYPLFAFTGLTLWQLFVEALNTPLQQLTAGRRLITRSRVPHEALILAGVYDLLLKVGVRLVLTAVMAAVFIEMRPSMVALPIAALSLLVLGLGVGLVLTPLGLLYDDVQKLLALAVSLLFFLTPVLYPIPPHPLLDLNPLAPLIETSRSLLVRWEMNQPFLIVSGAGFVLLIFAWLAHRLARRHLTPRLS